MHERLYIRQVFMCVDDYWYNFAKEKNENFQNNRSCSGNIGNNRSIFIEKIRFEIHF